MTLGEVINDLDKLISAKGEQKAELTYEIGKLEGKCDTYQIPLLQSLENLLNVTLPDLLTPVDRQSKTDETSRTMKAIDHLRKLDFQIVALNNHISKLKEIILEAEELQAMSNQINPSLQDSPSYLNILQELETTHASE